MGLEIRDMRPEDMDGKSYVHWKSWHETYSGMMEKSQLAGHTLEKCKKITHRWPENTLVAQKDGKIAGFTVYTPRRSSDCAAIAALYA